MKSPKDPVDHSRTTRPHAGESMTDTKNMPALIVIGMALACFIGGLTAHATSHHSTGLVFGSISAVLLVLGLAVVGHRAPASAWRRRTLVRRTSRSSPAATQQLVDLRKKPSRSPGWAPRRALALTDWPLGASRLPSRCRGPLRPRLPSWRRPAGRRPCPAGPCPRRPGRYGPSTVPTASFALPLTSSTAPLTPSAGPLFLSVIFTSPLSGSAWGFALLWATRGYLPPRNNRVSRWAGR